MEIQKLGVVFKAVGRRNSCLKNPSIEAATQTSEGAVDLFAAELIDEAASGAAAIGDGAAAMVGAFAGALDARAAAELLVGAVALTKARTGMRKDLKLVPDALTVR